MLIILLRTIILYAVVLFTMRIMGKSELSKLDPFQMVTLFMIAELAAIPIESPDVSVLSGVTAILVLLFLEILLSMLSIKSPKMNRFLNGKPSIIIDGGTLDIDELKKLRITIDDLNEHLRLKDFSSIADVDYAILEANGDLSVIPKPEKAPLTRGDLNIVSPKELMPMVVISDGVLQPTALKRLGKSESKLKKELAAVGIEDYQEVFICFYDETGKLHIHAQGALSKDLAEKKPSPSKQKQTKVTENSASKNKHGQRKGKKQ